MTTRPSRQSDDSPQWLSCRNPLYANSKPGKLRVRASSRSLIERLHVSCSRKARQKPNCSKCSKLCLHTSICTCKVQAQKTDTVTHSHWYWQSSASRLIRCMSKTYSSISKEGRSPSVNEYLRQRTNSGQKRVFTHEEI